MLKPSPHRGCLALALGVLGLVTTSCQLSLDPLAPSVEEEVQDAVDRGFDGIIVYVDQPESQSFYAAGWKDREAQVAADPHALFKIASISKLYIAAATSMRVAEGELSLDATLDQLVPEVDGEIANAERITLRMLLQHRSGIPDFVYHPDFSNDPELSEDPDNTYLSTASLIYGQAADFDPDERYAYSNTNFLLIGEILDRSLGYSHHEYIASEILAPLGLVNTFSLMGEVDPERVSSGYYVGYAPDLKLLEDHTRPGGSMVASAEDVAVFVRALVDGTLLTTEEQAIYSSVYSYEHTGWVGGYTSIVRYHPDTDAVVVQFVNTSHGPLYWIELERTYERITAIVEREALR